MEVAMLRSALLAPLIGLAACSTESPPPSPAADPSPPPAIIDAQVRAIEKAKAVERDVRAAQKKVDEAMDAPQR
jgi:hypothetical protein